MVTLSAARRLVDEAGSVRAAAEVLLEIERALFARIAEHNAAESEVDGRLRLDRRRLARETEAAAALRNAALKALAEAELYRAADDTYVPDVHRLWVLTGRCLHGVLSEAELKYVVRSAIRERFGRPLSAMIAEAFERLSYHVNEQCEIPSLPGSDLVQAQPRVLPAGTLWDGLAACLRNLPAEVVKGLVWLFLDACRLVGHLVPSTNGKSLRLHAASVDAEHLISHLYGLPTSIRGFDDLFGGGLRLTERPQRSVAPSGARDRGLHGRLLLLRGRSGSGKTLLGLQLAVEVARKGGIGVVMPLEQTAEECLYVLGSIGAGACTTSFEVATDPLHAGRLMFGQGTPSAGALIILSSDKGHFADFFSLLELTAQDMQRYPLGLIVVDPINSIGDLREPETGHEAFRAQTLSAIDKARSNGVNLLLVAEDAVADGEHPGRPDALDFVDNIADTYLRLSVEQRHGYAQRFLEVPKSRLQRELRGEHPFAIKAGHGIVISPSSPAVRSRVRGMRFSQQPEIGRFGVSELDDLLGPKAFNTGDTIVLEGPPGTHKTQLGRLFIRGANQRTRGRWSLLVTAQEDALDAREQFGTVPGRKLLALGLPLGYVDPGFIMQRIDDQFGQAADGGGLVDRVVVEHLYHLEMSCPFVRHDETFGDTLVSYLRRQQATSLFICLPDSGAEGAVLQRSIIDRANVHIRLNSVEFRGEKRVILQVVKTPAMRHSRESYEVRMGPHGLEVRHFPSLLRVLPSGQVEPINVTLFLHAETDTQANYNRNLCRALSSVVSREAKLEDQNRILMGKAMALASRSVVDELQVLQLDEFQVGSDHNGCDASLPLLPVESGFSAEEVTKAWVGGMGQHVRVGRSGKVVALPFYNNVALLAYRADLLDSELQHRLDRVTWAELAQQGREWEAHDARRDRQRHGIELFFDFPRDTPENYNCLYLEMLASVQPPPKNRQPEEWLGWVSGAGALATLCDYHALCRPGYLRAWRRSEVEQQEREMEQPIAVSDRAIVWRHWYSTLNQMLAQWPQTDRPIEVRPLPGGVSMAGEWYLAVPQYTAAPQVGEEIMKHLTTRDAELRRLRAGIGLPTTRAFYGLDESRVDKVPNELVHASPFFQMTRRDLAQVVDKPLRRSSFPGYATISETLAATLQQVLELPDLASREQEVSAIRPLLAEFRRRADYARAR